MTDLNDVNYTAGAGIDGQFLKYVNANNRWEAAAVPGGVSSVNGDAGPNVVLDTDDISEGSSNLYYTNARFDTQLGTKTTDNLTEGSSNLYYTNARFDARFDTQLGTKTTDNLTEGSSNLYYTNTRFDTQLGTKTTDNLTEGSSNLYYTNARFDTQLGTKDTGDLSEGSNLYYTNARADARIGAANLTDLNDVNYTAGSGIDGYVLEYVHANNRWEAKEATGGGGGSRPTVTEITSTPYTISNPSASTLEEIYMCDTGASAVTLPTAIGNEGVKIQVKNRISSAITVSAPNPGTQQTIDGSNSVSITSQYESLTFVSDNTNWNII